MLRTAAARFRRWLRAAFRRQAVVSPPPVRMIDGARWRPLAAPPGAPGRDVGWQLDAPPLEPPRGVSATVVVDWRRATDEPGR